MPKTDFEKIKKVKEMYLEGYGATTIADSLGVTTSTIYFWRNKYGWDNEMRLPKRDRTNTIPNVHDYAKNCAWLTSCGCSRLKATYCKRNYADEKCPWFETSEIRMNRYRRAIKAGALTNIEDYALAKSERSKNK